MLDILFTAKIYIKLKLFSNNLHKLLHGVSSDANCSQREDSGGGWGGLLKTLLTKLNYNNYTLQQICVEIIEFEANEIQPV